MDHDTQPTLLERLREGNDALAWETFFDRYGRLIFTLARSLGCQEASADEIVQETMLAVFRGQDVFRYDPARGRFRDWLAAVVRNAVAQRRRCPAARIRARGGAAEEELAAPTTDGGDHDWEAAFEDALLAVLLEAVRREVNPATYQAFELLAIHDLPGDQAAAVTGLSRNAVYKARERVLQRLRDLGAAYREDGRLGQRLKQALAALPAAAQERSLTARLLSRPDAARDAR